MSLSNRAVCPLCYYKFNIIDDSVERQHTLFHTKTEFYMKCPNCKEKVTIGIAMYKLGGLWSYIRCNRT